MRSICHALMLSATCVLANCKSSTGPQCVALPTVLTPAILLRVRDTQTNALVASNVTVYVRATAATPWSLTVQTSADPQVDPQPIMIGQSSGTYLIRVAKPGYSEWLSAAISVAETSTGGCYGAPVTVSIEADLQKST